MIWVSIWVTIVSMNLTFNDDKELMRFCILTIIYTPIVLADYELRKYHRRLGTQNLPLEIFSFIVIEFFGWFLIFLMFQNIPLVELATVGTAIAFMFTSTFLFNTIILYTILTLKQYIDVFIGNDSSTTAAEL